MASQTTSEQEQASAVNEYVDKGKGEMIVCVAGFDGALGGDRGLKGRFRHLQSRATS